MAEIQSLLAQIDQLSLEELDELRRRIDTRRTALRNTDPRRQTQEALRIRQEVNSEIDQALESARRYHHVAKV
jgi:hypothetical protein